MLCLVVVNSITDNTHSGHIHRLCRYSATACHENLIIFNGEKKKIWWKQNVRNVTTKTHRSFLIMLMCFFFSLLFLPTIHRSLVCPARGHVRICAANGYSPRHSQSDFNGLRSSQAHWERTYIFNIVVVHMKCTKNSFTVSFFHVFHFFHFI